MFFSFVKTVYPDVVPFASKTEFGAFIKRYISVFCSPRMKTITPLPFQNVTHIIIQLRLYEITIPFAISS